MIRLSGGVLLGFVLAQAPQQVSAIVDVTLVPMDRDRLLTHQTVIVEQGRIKTIGDAQSTRIPNSAKRIDGRNRFLMPGLADMHVHFVRGVLPPETENRATNSAGRPPGIPASASSDHERENRAYALLFLSNGVTTVRNMWGSDTIDSFGREIDAGQVAGPYIYSTGPITDAGPPVWQSSRVVDTAAEAEDAVKSDKAKGYTGIKVYSLLSEEAYRAIVVAARRQELPVVGHVPISVGLMGAVTVRQDSIEHLDSFVAALQTAEAMRARKSFAERLHEVDLTKLSRLAVAIKEAGVWICPTMVVADAPGTDSAWLEKASYLPPDVFVRYRRMYPNWATDPRSTPEARAFNTQVVSALHKAGAHLLLGTDTVKPGTLPGYSLHLELEQFVKSGMTPFEAIRAGTADAAVFLHQETEFGTVAVGRRADLLLLDANPLEDVKNTEKLAGVMAKGRWFPVDELTQQMRMLRATYTH